MGGPLAGGLDGLGLDPVQLPDHYVNRSAHLVRPGLQHHHPRLHHQRHHRGQDVLAGMCRRSPKGAGHDLHGVRHGQRRA